ncbi:MAG: MG2 domain-containing protein [Planctomycetota bacterium]
MSNEQPNESPAPPEPSDVAQRRCERMLAFHLNAISQEESDLIRGRLETDPDWQRANAEAQAMLKGLKEDGPCEAVVPDDLGLRTVQRLRECAAGASAQKVPTLRDVTNKKAGETPAVRTRGFLKYKNFKVGHSNQKLSPKAICFPSINNQQSKIKNSFFLSARLAAAIFLVCVLPVAWLACRYWWSGSAGPSLVWYADSTLATGTPFTPCVLVRNTDSQQPLAGVRVVASVSRVSSPVVASASRASPSVVASASRVSPLVESTIVFEGVTDATGVAVGDSKPVADLPVGDYRLIVKALSNSGVVLDRAERDVLITKSDKLVLSPDRSQARPGETIRVRALLAGNVGAAPLADQPLTLDLLDPAGNRIGRCEKRSTKFGLAWAEFPLDTAAPEGNYTLRAESGALKTERAVEVKQYKLPPFKVTITSDKPWFKPTDRLTGRVEALTFDGYPMANVKGQARLCDESGQTIQRADIALDDNGCGKFDLAVAWDKERQTARIEVVVTDGGGRAASGQTTIRVASSPYIITVVPEAGKLVTGTQNCVYVIVRTPDNQPAHAYLRIFRDDMKFVCDDRETDEQGMTMFYFSHAKRPAEILQICASPEPFPAPERETLGITPQSFTVPVRPREHGQLLMRMEKVIFRAGETAAVKLYAGEAYPQRACTVALALRQSGHTVASAGVIMKDRQAEAQIAIPKGVSGALSLEATLVLGPNEVWTDSRALSVAGASGIKVVASADRPKYRPGDRATLDFHVSDAEGNGIPAAVSVVAGDDALLALTGENPGLAQALQAAGVNVLRAPNFPFDPASFTPEQGGSYPARAALAASASNSSERSKSDKIIVDGAVAKLAEMKLDKAHKWERLKQWIFGWVIIGITLLVLLGASGEPSQTIYGGLSVLTAVLGLCGFAEILLLDYVSGELLTIFWLALTGGHIYLLMQAAKSGVAEPERKTQAYGQKFIQHCTRLVKSGKDTRLALRISTLLGDCLLGIFFFFLCFADYDSGNNILVILLVLLVVQISTLYRMAHS